MRNTKAKKAQQTIRLLPPELINGSVSPLVGSNPDATPILMKLWAASMMPMPKLAKQTKERSRARARKLTANTFQTKPKKAAIKTMAPIKPNSSAMMAKIKSVCASGKRTASAGYCPAPSRSSCRDQRRSTTAPVGSRWRTARPRVQKCHQTLPAVRRGDGNHSEPSNA